VDVLAEYGHARRVLLKSCHSARRKKRLNSTEGALESQTHTQGPRQPAGGSKARLSLGKQKKDRSWSALRLRGELNTTLRRPTQERQSESTPSLVWLTATASNVLPALPGGASPIP